MARPKGSGLPIDRLINTMHESDDYMHIVHLRAKTELLSSAWERGEISSFEGAILDIDQYLLALQKGHVTVDEINEIVKHNSAKGSVLIPIEYIEVIIEGWRNYSARDGEISLGEAYKIEGGGQGKHKRLQSLKRLTRDMRLCDRVEFALADAERRGEPISKERAFAEVAELTSAHDEKVSADTVKRAYRRRGPKLREILASLLIGGATS